MIYIYYTAATLLLALVDYIRIRQRAGIVKNIDHVVSRWLAVAAGVFVWLVFTRPLFQWGVLLFIPGFPAIRGLVYDLALNKMRGFDWDYISSETNAKTDNFMNRFPFWIQRLIYASVLAIVLLINQFIL